MAKNIYLSIIIPLYNSEKTIKKTLDSIFSSSFNQSFEVIVINDASTDNSLKKIKNYSIRLYSNKKNQGPAYSRNFGAKKSRGKLLLFLDSDVVLKKHTISNLVNHHQKLKSQKQNSICGAFFEKTPANQGFGSELNALHGHYLFQKNLNLYSSKGVLVDDVFPSRCGLVDKKTFFAINMFNEKYRTAACEDHDLGFRFKAKQIPIYTLLNSPVSHHFRPLFKSLIVYFKRGVNFLMTKKNYPQKKVCYGVNSTESINFILSLLFLSSLILSLFIPRLFPLSLIFLLLHLTIYYRFYFQSILQTKGPIFLLKAIFAMQLIFLSKAFAAISALFLIHILKKDYLF